ncbi:MAG TPA: PilZ domain-containing protein [Candidatus Sulfotelmatobacter sp.]|nr:PilZ domain-containing protein [Candidatus Sulfotelmatobacter sp.]
MRARHRQSLHTLTYVTLDEANGGIVRNLNHEGVAIQAVAALRVHQRVRVRFELRQPRVRVDCQGEVAWADASGQCGIRFLDLSPTATRQINEWILGDLLDSIPSRSNSIFGAGAAAGAEEDGLLLSSGARNVIQLQPLETGAHPLPTREVDAPVSSKSRLELDWLSRPLSGRQMAWTLNSLIVFAALLLFSLVFLSVTHELPRWPLDLEAGLGAAIFVVAFYCFYSRVLGGTSMGARLARLAGSDFSGDEEARDSARFR